MEDVEFEVKFDAVDQRLPARLYLVEAGVLESQNGHIERYDQNVHQNEVVEEACSFWASKGRRGSHEYECAVDVQSTDAAIVEGTKSVLASYVLDTMTLTDTLERQTR